MVRRRDHEHRHSRRGLGITAGLAPGLAHDLAVRSAHLGYHSLWSNDEPGASGLKTLADFAAAPPRLELGVSVLPLDRHQPAGIAAEIARLGLDPARLWIGIGSGRLPAPIDTIQQAVTELRQLLGNEVRIVLAAIRPQLCRVGGMIADGVLLNWMLPAQAARARRWVHEGAVEAGRTPPVVASYVRVAVGPGSAQRLRAEESYYRNINDGHRRHFRAMNVPLGSVGVAASTRPEVLDGLAPYHDVLDLPIARILAHHDVTALSVAAVAAAPWHAPIFATRHYVGMPESILDMARPGPDISAGPGRDGNAAGQTTRTCSACGPFGPCPTSNSTR